MWHAHMTMPCCHSAVPTATCRYTEICGFQGVFAGLLVGVKQIMPENDVTLVGYVKFRAKVSPAACGLLAERLSCNKTCLGHSNLCHS